jgi:aspartate/methionine/tyrosine aminotransferase
MKMGLTERGEEMSNLAVGVPDIPCPPEVSSILYQAIEKKHYGYVPSKGSAKALINLKTLLFDNESLIQPNRNLMVVNGAKYGIYLSLKTLCNAGDQVILMEPYWLSYPEIVHSLGLSFIPWVPKIDNYGQLTFDISDLYDIIKSKSVKVLVLNNPNNPSGKLFTKDWILELNYLLKKNNAFLIIDEVYRDIIFDRSKINYFEVYDENIIRVGSLSKSMSIPGLRAGYICSNQEFISKADLFNQHIQTCVNSLVNFLFENLSVDVLTSFADECSVIYKNRYEEIENILKGSKLRLLKSEAAFYSLIDFSNYFTTGNEVCDFLARNLNIIAVPGLPYGQNFNSYIRICLTLNVKILREKFKFILNSLK